MAEDAVRLCKRGHSRILGKICRQCHAAEQARYHASAKGRAAVVRYNASDKAYAAQARYRATTKRWEAVRRYHLKGARERIAEALSALEREEEELAGHRRHI